MTKQINANDHALTGHPVTANDDLQRFVEPSVDARATLYMAVYYTAAMQTV
jgi:hypothetical protein